MAKYNHDKPKNHTVPSCGVVFEIGIASSLALHHCVRWLEPWKSIKKKKSTLSAGFEPARGDPNGFLVHRLNHSATTTAMSLWLSWSWK